MLHYKYRGVGMSNIDQIKTKKKVVAYLEDINTDFAEAHIAVTSGLGACSGMNEAYIFKSLEEAEQAFTKEEKEILIEIGEWPPSINKSLQPSSEASAGEELNQEKGNTMSIENLQKQLDDQKALTDGLLKQLAQERTSKVTAKYAFEAEASENITKTLAELDDAARNVILGAFDALVARTEEAVNKALGDVKVTEENPLKKALEKEEGHSEKTEVVEETLVQKAQKALDEKLNKGAK